MNSEHVPGISQEGQFKIQQELVQMLNDKQLLGKIRFPNAGNSLNRVQIQLFCFNNESEKLVLNFPNTFPNQPPTVSLENPRAPFFLCFSPLLAKDKWTPESNIVDVVMDVYTNLEEYYKSELRFQQKRTQELLPEPPIKREPEYLSQESGWDVKKEQSSDRKPTRKKTNQMNGCSDRELTQTKNLNRHFRSKLREVLKDLDKDKDKEHMEEHRQISDLFGPNRVGFEDIRKVLSNEWFRKQVQQQMENGRFLNKILGGTMGIKSKKLMIKYYHVMLSAVSQPQTFQRWKYE